MQLLNQYHQYQNKHNQYSPKFKQILPKHLYINSTGYGQDEKWALGTIGIIDSAKNDINSGTPFNTLIRRVAKQYNKILTKVGCFTAFGRRRTDGDIGSTPIQGRYEIYKQKFIEMVEKDPQNTALTVYPEVIYGKKEKLVKKLYTEKCFLEDTGVNISLNKTMLTVRDSSSETNLDKLYHDSSKVTCRISSPSPKTTAVVYKEVASIVDRVQNNKEELTPENINKITKDVARVHWLMSQTRPYYRGSAGIADIMAKSLFESKGIQVSCYKKDVNPNLEAFVRPYPEYVNEYKNFFSEALKPIQDSKSV